MFRVICFSCFGIVAEFKFCFVLGNGHIVRFLDVGTESLVCSTTNVADYISSVVIGNLAKFGQRIIGSSLVVISVTTLTHSSIGTVLFAAF
jgi:hypothetical protein